LLLVTVSAASAAVEPDAEYDWPLDLPKAITSSFAEYRPGRFHAGIDLRTSGVGRDVRVPSDGYVWRVRCSPWGYGKAVYLKLHDRRTVVFGHLDAFAEPLGAYVRGQQHAGESYTVDLYPEPSMFPVARGEVIAQSGQTGMGPPHLHYEIRDEAGRPINPRSVGVTWPDTTRPVVSSILIAPADSEARVNGDLLPAVLPVTAAEPGVYRCAPVKARGRIGFAVSVIDPANEGASRLGVYALRASVGDRELFRVQNDCVSYEANGGGSVAFHPFFLDEGPFLVLWRWPGNRAEPFGYAASEGWFSVPAGSTEVHITAEDFCGNSASVTVPIVYDDATVEPPASAVEMGTGKVDLSCMGTWLVATARFSTAEPDTPTLEAVGAVGRNSPSFVRVAADTFRAGYFAPPGGGDVVLRVHHPRIPAYERIVHTFVRGAGRRSVALDGGVGLEVASNSPYGAMFARGYALAEVAPSPIKTLGGAYRIWPADTPIDEDVTLTFPVPEGVEKLDRVAVYRLQSGRWSPVSTTLRERALRVQTQRFGTFAVMEDNSVPRISDICPSEGAALTSLRPAITAAVSDHGSGISDVNVRCNGKWLLVEYDPEGGRIAWARDEDLPAGEKRLAFSLSDGAGNTTVVERHVTGP